MGARRWFAVCLFACALLVGACTPGGDPAAPTTGSVISVGAVPMQISNVTIGESVELSELDTIPGGKVKVRLERSGENKYGRAWVDMTANFSNGDTFGFRVYQYLGGDSVASTFIGRRLSVILSDVRVENGKKIATVGTNASGGAGHNLASDSPERKTEISNLRKGSTDYDIPMERQLNRDGLNLSARIVGENDGRSLMVSCGIQRGYTGLSARVEMYPDDSVTIPAVGTCRLVDFKDVRSATERSGAALVEVRR